MAELADLSKEKGKRKGGFVAPNRPPDPLSGVEYADPPSVEHDAAAEFSALLDGFKQRKKAEDARYKAAVDSEFWVAVCFQSRAEKEKFLRALNLIQLGDKYIDGRKAAQLLGVDLKGS